MDKKYVIDGFSFPNASEYERAKKEKETVAYLSVNTDMTDSKEVYRIYKKAVEKRSFQTVFGWEYMEKLRSCLIAAAHVEEDVLDAIPVGIIRDTAKLPEEKDGVQKENELKKYQEAYRKVKAGSSVKSFLIAAMLVVIAAMLIITFRSRYSIFTYFTNYEDNIRNEVVNEYEKWERELKEKEENLEQRERKLEEEERTAQEEALQE